MSEIEALATTAGLGVLGASLIALPKSPPLPVMVAITGVVVLLTMVYDTQSQACIGTGCGRAVALWAIYILIAAASLACGVVSAVAWRALFGLEAKLWVRIILFTGILLPVGALIISRIS